MNISTRQYLIRRAADPADGIRVLDPAEPVISLRRLIESTFAYAFSIDDIYIFTMRSAYTDTDIVSIALEIDERRLPILTKYLGDVKDGAHQVKLIADPATTIPSDAHVRFSYVVANKGNVDQFTIDATTLALNMLADAAGDYVNSAMGMDIALVGGQLVEGAPGVLGSAIAEFVKVLANLLHANCDGVVAIDTMTPSTLTGRDLAAATRTGVHYEARYYPGNLDPDSDTYAQVYKSAAGCGADSNYAVYLSVYRRSMPGIPNLAPQREFDSMYGTVAFGTTSHPTAVAGTVHDDEFVLVFMVDRFGWMWEHRLLSGWQHFVNRGAPPRAIGAGSPCVVATPDGYWSAFVIGNNGRLSELVKREKGWRWDDHESSAGLCDSLVPSPTVTVQRPGVIRLFVLGQAGGVWHLPHLDGWGWQDWIYHGSPPGAPGRALSAVTDAAGVVRVFVTGANGHLYQYVLSTNQWLDHGRPPDGAPVGGSFFPNDYSVPTFVASQGYTGGLVLGHNRRIYELCSYDGNVFTWYDHGEPPDTAGAEGWTQAGLTLIGLGRGSPALVVTDDGLLSALLVSDSGHLSELYRTADLKWQWVPIGRPPAQKGKAPVAISDPTYVITPAHGHNAYVAGNNGHLYEVARSSTNHAWAWKDLSV